MRRFTQHVQHQLVGYIALFIALGGVSYAAVTLPSNSVTSKQIKPKSVKGSDLGSNAVTSPKVKDGSLLIKDFKAGQLVAGAPGATGATGPAGAKGDTGATGAKGDTGAQGLPGPFPATLPAGKTLTGLFGMLGDDDGTGQHEGAATEISFPYPLAADPAVTIIQAGGAPTTACPGTPDVPKATSGHLCIYVAIQAGNANTLSFYNPTSDSKYGVVLYTNGTSTGRIDEAGTWAVTG